MKKISFIVLGILMFTIFGCMSKDDKKIEKERVVKLDSIISEFKKVEKRAVGDSVLDGIYIKTAARTEAYLFDYLGELTFEQKVALITKMDGATAVYIVLSNRYVLWKNYVNLNGFSAAPEILSIIGLKTEVFNVKLNRVTYANGQELTTTTTGTGLRGYYFTQRDLSNLSFSRVDPSVNFDWAENAPAAQMEHDNFSVVWVGQIQIPVSGNYVFYTASDDGSRLWFNDELIVDQWVDQAVTRENSRTITNLVAGTKYNIRMEFYENAGGANAVLGWVRPGGLTEGEVITAEYLFPGTYQTRPKINIDATEVMQKVVLKGGVVFPDGVISEVRINWGDGTAIDVLRSSFSAINIEHNYLNTGNFVVEIKVRDSANNEYTENITVVSSQELIKKEKIIFFGDSITQQGYDDATGYVRLFERDYDIRHPEINLEVIGAGIGGNRVADLQGRLERDVLSKNPTTVVVYIGINDVWNQAAGVTEEQFRVGLKDVVDRIIGSGARVILCTPSVIGEIKNGGNSLDAKLDIMSNVSRGIALERNITLVDLRKAFVDYLALNNPSNLAQGILTTDGVHMNNTGNRLIADQILSKIDTTVVVSPNTLRSFFIGNSVTDSINYGGLQDMAVSRNHTHIWSRHMIPGAPLSWLWEHPNDGFLIEPYGTPTNAFSQYVWDAISLQPFDRNILGDDGDLAMSNNYINIAKTRSPNVQIYIYQRWPRKPADFKNTADEWNTLWLSSYNLTSPGWSNIGQEARTYPEQLIGELRKVHTNMKPCLMVPVGEVFYELNKKMALGQVPGYSNVWNIYSDGIHMTNVGSFVVAATFYATMYKEDPRGIVIPGAYGTIPVDIKNIILQTIWDVLRNYKDSTGKTWSGLSSDVTTIPVTGVAIDRASLELSMTTSYTLTTTITPSNATNKEVRWSSGNTAVCTVDQTGRVTPVGSGNATITVTTVDGSRTAQCAVTVSVSNIAVTGITVAPTSATLIKGNTTTLGVVITPSNATNKSLTWTSSAPSVATVNAAGVVTAIAKGSAVITATTVSGGLQAVCNITVTVPNTAPVAVISATPTTGIAPLTVQFSASGSRDNDAGDYVLGYDWEFGYNNGVASSVSPQYTYTVPGVYTVRLRVMDSNNLRGEWVSTIINVTSNSDVLAMDTNAATSMINFNNLTATTNVNQSLGVNLDISGYRFWCDSGMMTPDVRNWTGSSSNIVLHGISWGSTIALSRINQTPFSLKSVKLLRPYNTDQATSVKITASLYNTGTMERVVNITLPLGLTGIEFVFPADWQTKAMKEYKFEFMELDNGGGGIRFGAIDDVVVNPTVYTAPNTTVQLSSIAVTTSPQKVTYSRGESTIDLSGLLVTGYYSNGVKKSEDITLNNITGFNTSTAGRKTITVSFGGKTTTFTITVNDVIANGMIIDHRTTDLSKVPATWIAAAKASQKIAYSHTSHGSQIITGMNALSGEPGLSYTYADGTYNENVLMNDMAFEGAYDLGNPNRTQWATSTRNLLNRAGGCNRNVIMWSWCGQAETSNPADIETYLTLMNQLELDYPNVKFVYMTGHLTGTGANGFLNQRNEQIRNYCKTNNKILFDFADIESYDPDGLVNYMALEGNDNCEYDSNNDLNRDKNWAQDWIASHPNHELTRLAALSQDAAHSQKLNAVLKGRAFWWLLARLAGWDGVTQ